MPITDAAEPVGLSELKAWARVDHCDDDSLISNLGVAAREYVEQATGRTFDDEATTPEKARLAIMALTAHWYDERNPVVVGHGVASVPMHVGRLIHQLRDWAEPATATGEGESE